MPMLQKQRESHQGSQHHLRGLHGENGGGGLMAARKKDYHMSIRCYFPGGGDNKTQHYPVMPLKDIAKWVEAYEFTHPTAESLTIKIWLKDEETN